MVSEGSISGSGKIFIQFATVQTPDWETLSKNDKILIQCTNSQGKYERPLPYTVEAFKEEFFLVRQGLWQKRVRAEFDQGTQMYQLIILDPLGQETGKKYPVGTSILKNNFMAES